MKFGFVTCVKLGMSCMEAIYEVGGHLDFAISLLDSQAVNKSGRVYLDDFCVVNSIPLLKSSHINNQDCIDAIKAHEIDWLFIIGWSQIANKEVLSAPKKGVLGIHPTLLPQGRGRASIPWAILKGLNETGVTLFKLDEGVDTGDILEQRILPLNCETTATDLYENVDLAHIQLMKDTFPKLASNEIILRVQDESKATEWPGRGPSDGEIDLEGSVVEAEKLVRAVTKPYPGAFVFIDGSKFIIWSAKISKLETGNLTLKFADGFLECLDFEPENKIGK